MRIIYNKQVKFNYFIIKELEAGIVLEGNEVKSIRNKNISIKESFCKIINNEIWLFQANISRYKQANTFNIINETRERKLLLKRNEINKLQKEIKEKNYTIVPLEIYFKKNKCKIKICLVKGKKNYDKRHTIKDRDLKRKED